MVACGGAMAVALGLTREDEECWPDVVTAGIEGVEDWASERRRFSNMRRLRCLRSWSSCSKVAIWSVSG